MQTNEWKQARWPAFLDVTRAVFKRLHNSVHMILAYFCLVTDAINTWKVIAETMVQPCWKCGKYWEALNDGIYRWNGAKFLIASLCAC